MHQTTLGNAMFTCLFTGFFGAGVGSKIGTTAAEFATAPFTFTGIMSDPQPLVDIAATAGKIVGGLAGFATTLIGFASSDKIVVLI